MISSKYLKNFIEISSLTHVLLRSILLNFQVFWDFPSIFLLISSLIALRSNEIV